jgi:hypothetical protein
MSDCLCVVAYNRYDDEIMELNDEGTDVTRFIEVNTGNRANRKKRSIDQIALQRNSSVRKF